MCATTRTYIVPAAYDAAYSQEKSVARMHLQQHVKDVHAVWFLEDSRCKSRVFNHDIPYIPAASP
jgi:hypothetical protein